MKRIIALFMVIAGGIFGLTLASASSATPEVECTPSPEIPEVQEVSHFVTVVDVEGVDQWYSWTGGQSETHPFPSEHWNPDNGNHNGEPFDQPANTAFQVANGENASWFYHHVVIEVTHEEKVIDVPYSPGVPAVECDDPSPEPSVTPSEEPTPEPSVTPSEEPTPETPEAPTPRTVTHEPEFTG